jgi:hypothetical protein
LHDAPNEAGNGETSKFRRYPTTYMRRIVMCFDRLEKEKTALILCITISQTETLHYIRDGVGELLPSVDVMASRVAEFVKKRENNQDGDIQKVSHNCPLNLKSYLIFDPNQTPLEEEQAKESNALALRDPKRPGMLT